MKTPETSIVTIDGAAKAIYPKIHWHVSRPFDEDGFPPHVEIMGTISFYARTKIMDEHLNREYTSQIVAKELEGVKVELENIIQEWLEK